MKKVLLSGAALVALMAAPAQAEGLSLDLAGHFKGYGVWNNNDEAAGVSLRELNIRKETEVHFTGETTLDSGLTVGVHVELEADADDNSIEESYAYMSGGWGRVNVGEEDGVAYLLQVAAPSADSNIDGLRQYISTYNATGVAGGNSLRLDYDHVAPVAAETTANKVSYMTPVFNGFQAGVSYTPSLTDSANGFTSTSSDETAGAAYDDSWEVAARYEGAFEGVGVAFGAGWGTYNAEEETAGAGNVTDDADTWNVGLDLNFGAFGLGAAYLNQETEINTADIDVDTWVVGADYTMGAYTLGASYLNQNTDTAAADTDIDRWTAGATYSYGPGMSFRGSVSMIDNDNSFDATQVTLGTQINF